MAILTNNKLGKALMDRGLLPEGCRLIEVSMKPGDVTVLRYEKFVTPEELGKVADALKEASQE